MTSPFWAAAFLGWVYVFPPACVAVTFLLAARWWWRQWRKASALTAETAAAAGDVPVPYWPADDAISALARAVTCRWCAARPTGRCICGVWCGHQQCPRLTRADLDYLDHGTEMPR